MEIAGVKAFSRFLDNLVQLVKLLILMYHLAVNILLQLLIASKRFFGDNAALNFMFQSIHPLFQALHIDPVSLICRSVLLNSPFSSCFRSIYWLIGN